MAGTLLLPGSVIRAKGLQGSTASSLTASAAGIDPMIGIQIGPGSFVDEGVEPLLDWLYEKAGVNTIAKEA